MVAATAGASPSPITRRKNPRRSRQPSQTCRTSDENSSRVCALGFEGVSIAGCLLPVRRSDVGAPKAAFVPFSRAHRLAPLTPRSRTALLLQPGLLPDVLSGRRLLEVVDFGGHHFDVRFLVEDDHRRVGVEDVLNGELDLLSLLRIEL